MPRSRIRFGEGRVFQLRVELDGISPPVWRRVLVSGTCVAARVARRDPARDGARHRRRLSFRGGRSSLHRSCRRAVEPARRRTRCRLNRSDCTPAPASCTWPNITPNRGRHVITLEQIAPRLVGQRLPACVAGGRAAPPDDCDRSACLSRTAGRARRSARSASGGTAQLAAGAVRSGLRRRDVDQRGAGQGAEAQAGGLNGGER